MSLVKTKIFMNITGVTFVYGASPTTVTITEVTDIPVDEGGDLKQWSADDAPGPSAQVVVNRTRMAQILGADLAILKSIPQGVEGTLTWTENDLKNGSSTGSVTCVLSNCMRVSGKWGGKHNEFKEHENVFAARWALVTGAWVDPLVCTQAA